MVLLNDTLNTEPLFAPDEPEKITTAGIMICGEYLRIVHTGRFRPAARAIIEACEEIQAEEAHVGTSH